MIYKILRLFRRHKPQEFKPVILVTGCSSGIGLALAQLLISTKEYRVVGTARSTSLDETRKKFSEDENFQLLPLDVKVGEQRQKLIAQIKNSWGGVDILINNAGISYRAVVEHMDEGDELNQLRTNFLGPMAMTRLVLPFMRENGRGKIINVSSVSGMLAMPTMSSYSASKYALEGATEALWYEMKPLGINVSLIQPGFINSSSFQRVYQPDKAQAAEDSQLAYSDYYAHMSPFIEQRMRKSFATPQKVAKTILKVIKRQNPPLRVPATLDASIFYYLRRLIPRRLFHQVLFYALPGAKNWAKAYSNSRRLK